MSTENTNYVKYRAYFEGWSDGAGGRPIKPRFDEKVYNEAWSEGWKARQTAVQAYAEKVGVIQRVIREAST